MSVAEALAFTRSRSRQILMWSALSAAVGLILQAVVERFKLGGVIASRLLGLAWALGTTFVVPILVIENTNVLDAVSRSAKTFKEQWGPSVTADGAMGIVMLIALIPVVIVAAVIAALNVFVGIAVGVVALFALMAFMGTFSAIKNVALYRFATEGVVVGDFTVDQLNGAFTPKKKRRFF